MIFSGIKDRLFQLVNELHTKVDERIEEEERPEPLPKNPFPILDSNQESLLRNWLNAAYPNRCAPIEWTNEEKIADTARRQVVDAILTSIETLKRNQQSEMAA